MKLIVDFDFEIKKKIKKKYDFIFHFIFHSKLILSDYFAQERIL